MECQFEIGNRVITDAGAGEVIEKTPAGSGYLIDVDLDDGGVITIDCRQAREEEQ